MVHGVVGVHFVDQPDLDPGAGAEAAQGRNKRGEGARTGRR
jgi:hypothetical protein